MTFLPPDPVLSKIRWLARRQDGMVTWRQLEAYGVSRRQLGMLIRREGWRAPYRGTFLLPGADPVRGPIRAALVGRPGAVVCGLTAARLLGLGGLSSRAGPLWTGAPGSSGRARGSRGAAARSWSATSPVAEPVHLLVPRGSGAVSGHPGLVMHRGACRPEERRLRAGLPVTTVERTLVDLVLASSRETAVSLLDAALHGDPRSGGPGLDSLDQVRRLAVGRRHIAGRWGWFDLADGRSESPLETRLRLLLADAGLAPEELQWPVDILADAVEDPPGPAPSSGLPASAGAGTALAGVHSSTGEWGRARLDLAWPRLMVAIEADGVAHHSQPKAVLHDRRRQNALLELGWLLLRFTWADVHHRATQVVESVRRVLAARAGRL